MMNMIRHAVSMLRHYSEGSLALIVAGMALAGIFEGVGILLIVPLLGASGFVDGAHESVPLIGPLLDRFQALPADSLLPVLLGLFVLVIVCQSLLQRFVAVRNTQIVSRSGRKLRLEIFDAMQDARWSFYLRKRRTDLMSAMTDDAARVQSGFALLLQVASALIFTVLQVGIAFMMSWSLTAVVLACGAVLLLVSRRRLRTAKSLGGLTKELVQEYLGGINDQLQGMKDIKGNDMAHGGRKWIRSITERVMNEQIAYTRLRSGTEAGYRVASAVLVAVFAYFALRVLQTPPHTLLLIVIIMTRLWPRITMLQTQAQQLASLAPAIASIQALLEECRREREPAALSDGELRPLKLEQGIQLIGVTFRYEAAEGRKALDGIDLLIPARSTTAIVGHSGAGKTTLVDAVMGLIRPQEGAILVDGRPLTEERLAALRRSIGYVPQDPFLFNGTILDNLRLARPCATEEEVREALRFAAADGFVSRLPQDIHTPIGDRGIRLSGGERQRIVLARAILRKPRILVLDEATSALDSESEAAILDSLERLRGSMTIIVIAHRLSTIRGADQVVVMEQGRIVQCGRYAALAADRSGVFDRLLRQQAINV